MKKMLYIHRKIRLQMIWVGIFVLTTSILGYTQVVWALEDRFDMAKNDTSGISIKEKQVMEINQSLKTVIEENHRLVDKNHELEEVVNRLKTEKDEQQSRFQNLERDRNDLVNNFQKVKDVNDRFSQEIKELEVGIQDLQSAKETYSQRVEQLEEQLTIHGAKRDEVMLLASATPEEVQDREKKTLDLLSTIDAFTEEDARLRMDAAKAHYNMGNIYYQKGEYEIAVREYYQAVTLMPDDPDAHFNLAFVSGEHLEDYNTAFKHYQMYLYLKPDAEDAYFVKGKIVAAQLKLKNVIDSPLDKTKK